MTTTEQKLRLLSLAERKDILSRIAAGELTIVKYTRDGSVEESPDFAERRAAIIELNKMDERYGEGEADGLTVIMPGREDNSFRNN